MKKLLLMTCAAAAYAAHATPPEIGNVQFKQDENRLVTISYTLGGADAIVMMDVLTNGVSIGRALYSDATGDVNVRVKQGTRQILWQPRTTWPDQKIRTTCASISSRSRMSSGILMLTTCRAALPPISTRPTSC